MTLAFCEGGRADSPTLFRHESLCCANHFVRYGTVLYSVEMPRKTAAIVETPTAADWITELLDGKRPRKMQLEAGEKLLREYPNHDGTKMYVYRVDPPIDQKVLGIEGSNIGILQHPYPQDLRAWAKALHGGGKYEFKFNDYNLDFPNIGVFYVEVPLEECDPIVDVRVLKRGKAHVEQLIQKWINDGKATKDKDGNAIPMNLHGAQELHVHQANPQQDPVTSEVMAHALKRTIDKAFETPPPAVNTSNESTHMILQSVLNMNTLLMTKLLEQKPAAAPDPMASLETMLAVAERLNRLGGRRGAPPVEDWTDKVSKVLTPLAPMLDSMAQRFMAPAATAAAPQPHRPELPGAADSEAAKIERMRSANMQLAHIIRNCLQREQDGEDMATAIDVMFGPETYSQLCILGVEGIKKDLQVYAPEMWAQLNQLPAQIDQLLHEFVTAFDDAPEEAEQPELAHV